MRWWDGAAWTAHTHSAMPVAPEPVTLPAADPVALPAVDPVALPAVDPSPHAQMPVALPAVPVAPEQGGRSREPQRELIPEGGRSRLVAAALSLVLIPVVMVIAMRGAPALPYVDSGSDFAGLVAAFEGFQDAAAAAAPCLIDSGDRVASCRPEVEAWQAATVDVNAALAGDYASNACVQAYVESVREPFAEVESGIDALMASGASTTRQAVAMESALQDIADADAEASLCLAGS